MYAVGARGLCNRSSRSSSRAEEITEVQSIILLIHLDKGNFQVEKVKVVIGMAMGRARLEEGEMMVA